MKFRAITSVTALFLVACLPAVAQPAPSPTKLFAPAADIPALIAKAKAAQKSPQINSVQPLVTLSP